MARSNVPKFGNWENEDSVPYTVYFDKARKKKGETMINPNDPQENPDMSPAKHFRQSGDSPARSSENVGPRTYNNNKNNITQRPVRPVRPNACSDQIFERSPLHPQYLAGRGGGGYPAREVKSQARTRLRPVRGGESPGRSNAAVPKFGAWNDIDPQSDENFTHIFNQVRDERNTGGVGNPSATTQNRHSYVNHSQRSDQPKICCCPWW